MPLLSLWSSNPDAIKELSIEQIVSTAGDGRLRDGSDCSRELRAFLAQVSSERLATYVEHCSRTDFPKSRWVLQDLIDELGRRLDYRVENGRYDGSDGAGEGSGSAWHAPE